MDKEIGNKNNYDLVVVKDPLGDYKFAEKREIELEKFYEQKIFDNIEGVDNDKSKNKDEDDKEEK